jgi:hypothetical protein
VGLPKEGDLCRLVRLRSGIQVAELFRPPRQGLVFHAVVDERDDNLSATWETLQRSAERLYQRTAKRWRNLNDKGRIRVLELLFARYLVTRDQELFSGVEAFPRVRGSAVDLGTVLRWSSHGPVQVIDADQNPGKFDLEGRQVLRLERASRRFLDQGLGLELVSPPLKVSRARLPVSWRKTGRRLAEGLARVFARGPGRRVRDSELDQQELAFLEAVRAEVRSGAFALEGEVRPFAIRVRMAEDQRVPWIKVRRAGKPSEFRIARCHPLVESMIARFAHDTSYVYPALTALTRGEDGYFDTREDVHKMVLDRHKIRV